MPADARTRYKDLAGDARRRTARLQTLLQTVDPLVPWLSLAWIGIFAAALFASSNFTFWWIAGFLIFSATCSLLYMRGRWQRQLRYWSFVLEQSENGIRRLQRDWSPDFYEFELSDDQQWLARDLNLTGPASAFELISTAYTDGGLDKLHHWLLEPAHPDTIIQRQSAVRWLANEDDFRRHVEVSTRVALSDSSGLDRLKAWCLQAAPRAAQRGSYLFCWISPFILMVSAALAMGKWISPHVGFSIATSLAVLNFLFTIVRIGPVHDVFRSLQPHPASRRLEVGDVFRELARLPEDVSELKTIRVMAADAAHSLSSLRPLMRLSLLSRIPWLVLFIYLPLQSTLLIDFHLLRLIERWKRRHGTSAAEWVEAFARFEAYSSLATLASDHPTWSFPQVDEEAPMPFSARQLGHPLLPQDARVANDVNIVSPQHFLLITGSNMSGKSTMLRAIGLNAVLAQTGAPVCAESLSMSPLRIATSMRIVDSLQDGVSLFMAELKRLKRILEIAAEPVFAEPGRLLFLFDEVLHGTNTSERHVAVCRILTQLLRHNVIGGVTTHDLKLAEERDIADNATLVYFSEQLSNAGGQPAMTFDYVMKSGIAPTTNALKLLQLIGLDEPPQNAPASQN